MLKDAFDDIGILDERDDAQGGAAVYALEWIDLVDLQYLPPDILLPGESVSQDVKCLAEGQRRMSVPHSAIKRNAK